MAAERRAKPGAASAIVTTGAAVGGSLALVGAMAAAARVAQTGMPPADNLDPSPTAQPVAAQPVQRVVVVLPETAPPAPVLSQPVAAATIPPQTPAPAPAPQPPSPASSSDAS